MIWYLSIHLFTHFSTRCVSELYIQILNVVRKDKINVSYSSLFKRNDYLLIVVLHLNNKRLSHL